MLNESSRVTYIDFSITQVDRLSVTLCTRLLGMDEEQLSR